MRNPAALCTLLLLSACTAPPLAAERISLFRSLDSRQCSGGGTTPQTLAERLRAGGVEVLGVSCGVDGRMRPAMCGAGDGRIAIIEVAADQRARAEALGFAPLERLPDAQRVPCR